MARTRSTKNPYYNHHFVEISQVKSMKDLEYLFKLAQQLTKLRQTRDTRYRELLKAFTVAVMFYQQSSRTFGSFVSAAQGLGATVIPVHDMAHFSSTAKGENLEDSALTASSSWGADVIVQRHPENTSGTQIVAELGRLQRPTLVVNAGSGTGEHPTQALLDAYTIFNALGRLDHLHIVMVGDMRFGRTVKSLSQLLATVGQGNRITLVAPQGLEMPAENLAVLADKVELKQLNSLSDVSDADVVYWTRVQREWFEKGGQMDFYNQVKDQFILTPAVAAQFSKTAIFMHPLPRVNEIERSLDTDPRALYLTKEMASGLSVRMALLAAMLLEDPFSF
jgi:aspartate carbamoyltransferase catalytic subunit